MQIQNKERKEKKAKREEEESERKKEREREQSTQERHPGELCTTSASSPLSATMAIKARGVYELSPALFAPRFSP